jgi:hypothetical protein
VYKLSAGCSITLFHVLGYETYLTAVKRQKRINRVILMLHRARAMALIGILWEPTMK